MKYISTSNFPFLFCNQKIPIIQNLNAFSNQEQNLNLKLMSVNLRAMKWNQRLSGASKDL